MTFNNYWYSLLSPIFQFTPNYVIVMSITEPGVPTSLSAAAVADTAGSITVTWLPAAASTQDSYKVMFTPTHSTSVTESVLDPTTTVTRTDLVPGDTYMVTVVAVSGGIESDPPAQETVALGKIIPVFKAHLPSLRKWVKPCHPMVVRPTLVR